MDSLTISEILSKIDEIKEYKRRRLEYAKKYYSTDKGKEKLKEAKHRYYLKKKAEKQAAKEDMGMISIDLSTHLYGSA